MSSVTASTSKYPHDVSRQRTRRKCELGSLMACRLLLTAVLSMAFAIGFRGLVDCSRSQRQVPRVDIEPTSTDKSVTKVGENVYQTPEQAEADVKRLCKKSKPEDQPPRGPGKAE